ncbi:MAG: cbb3-type cytochrome c oxidase subunit 3 [Bacteroidota bacterium]
MFKQILENIWTFELLGIISLIIFFGMFVLIFVYVIKIDKKFIDYASSLPFEKNNFE